jgi:hypothetical protein
MNLIPARAGGDTHTGCRAALAAVYIRQFKRKFAFRGLPKHDGKKNYRQTDHSD